MTKNRVHNKLVGWFMSGTLISTFFREFNFKFHCGDFSQLAFHGITFEKKWKEGFWRGWKKSNPIASFKIVAQRVTFEHVTLQRVVFLQMFSAQIVHFCWGQWEVLYFWNTPSPQYAYFGYMNLSEVIRFEIFSGDSKHRRSQFLLCDICRSRSWTVWVTEVSFDLNSFLETPNQKPRESWTKTLKLILFKDAEVSTIITLSYDFKGG